MTITMICNLDAYSHEANAATALTWVVKISNTRVRGFATRSPSAFEAPRNNHVFPPQTVGLTMTEYDL